MIRIRKKGSDHRPSPDLILVLSLLVLKGEWGRKHRYNYHGAYVGSIWGFPKISGNYDFGVPLIRIIVFCGLYWCPSILGNYHIRIILGIHSPTLP